MCCIPHTLRQRTAPAAHRPKLRRVQHFQTQHTGKQSSSTPQLSQCKVPYSVSTGAPVCAVHLTAETGQHEQTGRGSDTVGQCLRAQAYLASQRRACCEHAEAKNSSIPLHTLDRALAACACRPSRTARRKGRTCHSIRPSLQRLTYTPHPRLGGSAGSSLPTHQAHVQSELISSKAPVLGAPRALCRHSV